MRVRLAGVALITFLMGAMPIQAEKVRDASHATVAIVQLPTSSVGDFAKMQQLATQAKAKGAELIIFPEGSVLGWLNPAVFTKAEPIPGAYSDQLAKIAKTAKIWLAAGLAERGPKAGEGALAGAYQAYDSAILINPEGEIVLHQRKINVLADAFNRAECQRILNEPECSYTPGLAADIKTVQTPFGKTALLVCADAYDYPPATALNALRSLQPTFVIVTWGITAAVESDCGGEYFDATDSAAQAAAYLKTSFVVGANAVGQRTYGRFLPSVYCGTSGYSTPTGKGIEGQPRTEPLLLMQISKAFDAEAGPVWNDADAGGKCPAVCSHFGAHWNGQWSTTVEGVMSVCGCLTGAGTTLK